LELGHYLYFGQLAERYFKRARGACAVLDIQRILFKPKIPWWEWVQNVVDVWDPAQKARDHQERTNEHWIGALGLGPRPDPLTTLSLGVAVVTSAGVQRKIEGDASPRRRLELAGATLPSVLNHAGTKLTAQLRLAAHAQRRLDAITAAIMGRKAV
jgi:hypothetical protein